MSRPSNRALGLAAAAALALASGLAAHFEGERLSAYRDTGGVWTLCDGHTRGVQAGDTATREQCRAWLQAEMVDALAAVQRCVHVPLTTGQLAAFADAAYNLGPAVVCGSTLQRKANAGDLPGACAELSRWVYAGGVRLRGLVARRAAERKLCEGAAP